MTWFGVSTTVVVVGSSNNVSPVFDVVGFSRRYSAAGVSEKSAAYFVFSSPKTAAVKRGRKQLKMDAAILASTSAAEGPPSLRYSAFTPDGDEKSHASSRVSASPTPREVTSAASASRAARMNGMN